MSSLELVVKGIALVIAIGLLLSSVDFSYLLAKLSIKSDGSSDEEIITNTDSFLKTLELWYLLKKRCDESKLMLASDKMDEVFPLLNDNIEGEK